MIIHHRIHRDQWGERGFTILELLAVFAILAIIAALAAPKYATVIHESKVKACKSNIEMLRKAAEMYREVEGDWPTEQQQLVEKGYINEYVYCPAAEVESTDTDYTLENEDVRCDNESQHAQSP